MLVWALTLSWDEQKNITEVLSNVHCIYCVECLPLLLGNLHSVCVCVCVWCTSSHRCIGGRKVWLYLHTHVSSLNLVSLTNLKWSSVPSHLVMSFSGHSRQDCRFADNVCLHDVSAIQVYHSVHNYCIWCTRYSKLTVSRPSFSEQRDTATESMANSYSSPSPRC